VEITTIRTGWRRTLVNSQALNEHQFITPLSSFSRAQILSAAWAAGMDTWKPECRIVISGTALEHRIWIWF
jgi:hypothetical protein